MGSEAVGSEVTLLSLNLNWGTSAEGRLRQAAEVERARDHLGGGPAVLALQETKPAALERFQSAGWDVLAQTRAPKGRLGVAVLGRGVRATSEALLLSPPWFEVGEVYGELAEWFAERAVAVDVAIGDEVLRFGSFHATPGTSAGPGKRGVGARRKPWFHRRLADWIKTWPRPYGFAIDANSPDTETLDDAIFFLPAGFRCEAGEDDLLGLRTPAGGPRHDAEDALRVWLRSAGGTARLAELRLQTEGPLWTSHFTRGGKAKRFDHIWVTPEVEPVTVRYWPPDHPLQADSISDHGIVGVRARVGADAV